MSRSHPLVIALGGLGLLLLYTPLVATAALSFNAARVGLIWQGFTGAWYLKLAQNEAILSAAWTSLLVALASTALATLLGTLLALGLERTPWPRPVRRALDAVVDLPVVTPDILFAAALVIAFSFLRQVSSAFQPGLLTLVIAHVTFQVAFVALVVRARMIALGRDLDEAARDLYASRWFHLRRVTLPLLRPGILAGALLAFTLSLDDFVISFFTAGPRSETLPIYVYASLRRGLSPEVHALSTLMVLASVVLVLGLGRLSRPASSTTPTPALPPKE